MPPTLPTRLSPPDLAVVAFYLVAITLFGLRFSKRAKSGSGSKQEKSLKSYFLADNTIPWWAIALSIVSAETSTLTIISIPGVAFAGDLGFLQVVLGYMLGRIVVALLFLPKYFRGEMLTAYQLIDQRFGPVLHKLTAGLFLLTRAAAEGVRVFAVSIVVGLAIGTGDILSIGLISALTLLYTFEGGLAAVIWTDVVQMALYVAGTLAAVWSLGHHVPGGWQTIHAVAAPLGKFHWLDFTLNLTTAYTFWAGLLGGTFLTMASHGTDQLMVQRLLAARNLRESRLALLSSGAVIFLQFTLFLLIGVGLFVFYGAFGQGLKLVAQTPSGGVFTWTPHTLPPNLSPDRIFPTFIVHQMPHGVAGLLVAAILAAAMSNLSAALNSLASTTVIDFYLPLRRSQRSTKVGAPFIAPLSHAMSGSTSESRTTTPSTTLISRVATLFWALVLFAIAVYAIQHGGKGHVVETGLSIASVAYGCLLGVFLLGTLTRYATQTGAILGMICGLALNLILWLLPGAVIYGCKAFDPEDNLNLQAVNCIAIPHIAFTWYVLIGSLATFAVGTLFSLLLPKRKPFRAALALLLLCLSIFSPSSLSFRSEAQESASSVASASVPASVSAVASADRYPKASALGLSTPAKESGLQPLGYALPSPSQPSASTPDFSPASRLINEAIAAHKLPGAVLLVGHNGHIAFEQAYGNRALEPAVEPMTTDTIFDMASLTKVLVTTTAILQLYEQGKLDLDTPLAHYLPAFAAPGAGAPPFPGTTGKGGVSSEARPSSSPEPQSPTHPYKSQITIRNLLTHYSGLPEDISLKDPWGLAAPDKAEGLRRALAATPYGPSAQTFKYSDINFILLGALVEKLSGQPLDEYATEHILVPLDMLHTRYLPLAKACGPKQVLGSAVALPPPPTLPPYTAGGIVTGSFVDYSCPPPHWITSAIIPETAPTAHDDESKTHPELNPDFDHLLRGTVHDPTTRRMGGVAGHAGLFSTAEDTAKFCQVLLDKLLNNTGPFPLTQATLRLAISPQEPPTAVRTATVFLPDGTPATGPASRGLGWDLNSPYSRPRGTLFPITTGAHAGSFGHTGFTGTSIWIDPTSDTYVILLANAIHPRGAPTISPLRGQVATAVAKALTAPPSTSPQDRVILSEAKDPCISSSSNPASCTLTGIDVLESTSFASLTTLAAEQGHPLKLGLLTNQAGIDAQGRRTIDILSHAPPTVQLTTIFTPEHGLSAQQDTEHLQREEDPTTHLPIISVYGPKASDKHPKQSDLKQIDALVIDLQDIGVPFWTYETVVGYALESCAQAKIPVFVLDRPNPNGGLAVQGPTSDPGTASYLAYTPIPVRHGLTLGELARYFNANATLSSSPSASDPESLQLGYGAGASATGSNIVPPATLPGLHAQLTVIRMQNWTRAELFPATGLPWTPPSPNMRTATTALVYPGVALLEFNPISVGRGTPAPYENIGAPYIKAPELAAYLAARHIPGVEITPTTLPIAETPEHYPYHGQTIPGLHFTVTDSTLFDSPEFGVELLAALHRLYPADFHLERCKTILLNAATRESLKRGDDPRDIAAAWQPSLTRFREARKPYLLYH